MAEVHGNRTHHPTLRRTTGFEVQEAHQDLSTSVLINARKPLKSQYLKQESRARSQGSGARIKEQKPEVRNQ